MTSEQPGIRAVAVVGGHGQIARHLLEQLASRGLRAIGVVRNPDHAAELEASGAEVLVFDVERETAAALAAQLGDVDALVFAAGAGPGSNAERKLTVDRDGAVLTADAAELAGIRRVIIVSAMAADEFVVGSDDVFQVYLRAKSEADAIVRARDLDWTVVRPGGLTNDEPTGRIRTGTSTGRGSIPRADVAALVLELLLGGLAVRRQFEVVSGDTPIADALAALS
jgi:uncharacterized protein YbjT (DUF2867 family)